MNATTIVELYDNLAAARRTLAVIEPAASPQTVIELRGLIGGTVSELKDALQALPEEDRETVLYDLSREYGEDVREDFGVAPATARRAG